MNKWNEDLLFTVKLAQQKLSIYYAKETPMMGMLPMSADIVDPFWTLWSYRIWDKVMDIDPEDHTSYTTQYQEAFLKYLENKYCCMVSGVLNLSIDLNSLTLAKSNWHVYKN